MVRSKYSGVVIRLVLALSLVNVGCGGGVIHVQPSHRLSLRRSHPPSQTCRGRGRLFFNLMFLLMNQLRWR